MVTTKLATKVLDLYLYSSLTLAEACQVILVTHDIYSFDLEDELFRTAWGLLPILKPGR